MLKLRRIPFRKRFHSRNLAKPPVTVETGLVMIQIDGLSRVKLESGMAEGRMPHLRRLMEKEGYRLHSLYSGLPSCTPASQAELFYGVKNAVPAFAFREPSSGKIVRMFSHRAAAGIQKDLAKQGRSLLAGGSSYSNIYDGGALRSSYCACQMGVGGILSDLGSLGLLTLLFRHPARLLRIVYLMAAEVFRGLGDGLRAKPPFGMWRREAIFFANRIFVSVCLREIITVLAARDIRERLPVVHVNYMGYDEHAHQRGPGSPTALAQLRKIDASISRLDRAMRESGRRFHCWIYSDHGQEAVRSFESATGKTLEAVIEEETGGSRVIREPDPYGLTPIRDHPAGAWLVSNPGPLVSLYPSSPLTQARKVAISEALVSRAGVPLVFHSPEKGKVRACTPKGWRELPEEGLAILGSGHPFPGECIADLIALCQHPLAGPLIVSGWRPEGNPLSFFPESGSHGGIGREEVHGFALLPPDVPLPSGKPYFRFLDLRAVALGLLTGAPDRSGVNP